MVTAAGGKVRKNPNGLEAILAKNIKLSDDGINHEMYKNKKNHSMLFVGIMMKQKFYQKIH